MVSVPQQAALTATTHQHKTMRRTKARLQAALATVTQSSEELAVLKAHRHFQRTFTAQPYSEAATQAAQQALSKAEAAFKAYENQK